MTSDTAWKVVVPSRYGKPNVYYFRTRLDAYGYSSLMEDYGSRAKFTEVDPDEVPEYTEHPARRTL